MPDNIATMNKSATQDPTIRYYPNNQSAGVWVAFVTLVGVISIGPSLGFHSFMLTSSLLLGAIVVGYLGYWALSRSCYFISSSKAGFKDAFRTREVQFDKIRSVIKNTGRDSSTLTFECNSGTVTMPLDPLNQAWFCALKAELLKRGIPFSSFVFGLPVKAENF